MLPMQPTRTLCSCPMCGHSTRGQKGQVWSPTSLSHGRAPAPTGALPLCLPAGLGCGRELGRDKGLLLRDEEEGTWEGGSSLNTLSWNICVFSYGSFKKLWKATLFPRSYD